MLLRRSLVPILQGTCTIESRSHCRPSAQAISFGYSSRRISPLGDNCMGTVIEKASYSIIGFTDGHREHGLGGGESWRLLGGKSQEPSTALRRISFQTPRSTPYKIFDMPYYPVSFSSVFIYKSLSLVPDAISRVFHRHLSRSPRRGWSMRSIATECT